MQGPIHKLHCPWRFYYYYEKPGTPSVSGSTDTLNSYRKNLHEVFDFDTKDVPPEWEFPLHKGGGQINFYAPREYSAHIFELMVLALIGGCFGSSGARISGINLTNKGTTAQFALWLQRGDDASMETIKETLGEILSYDEKFKQTTNIGYKKFGNE